MINAQYLPFTIDDLDIKKTFDFSGSQFKLRLRKNEQNNQFGLDIFDISDTIVYTGPLLYKTNFVNSIYPDLLFQIVAFDLSELSGNLNPETEITDDNLGVTVQLYTGLELV